MADSPVTREKAISLRAAGVAVSFYKHHNVEFLRRNIRRVRDRAQGATARTLPWYDQILKGNWDLIWFAVDGLKNLGDLRYAVSLCERVDIPYWIQLQHGDENFFLTSESEIDAYADICVSARRVVFIAERNRRSLERAIGQRLANALHSQNGLTAVRVAEAAGVAEVSPIRVSGGAQFFNLGRFSPKDKGQQLLLEALSDAKWKQRDWRLSFVGVSAFGVDYLKRLASYFDIPEKRVDVIPFTDDIFAEIARRDILLMPSLAEGTPYAMIESMACGRPAMGTPVGGIPELITEGTTGWLARTTDVADIHEALERMWADRAEWPAFGRRAREYVIANHNEEMLHASLLGQLKMDAA
ncbi:MAG: glycosyltransferase family 4 protein [bacterium]|nr:glycosyltransferase family 4 protein [bacterium]